MYGGRSASISFFVVNPDAWRGTDVVDVVFVAVPPQPASAAATPVSEDGHTNSAAACKGRACQRYTGRGVSHEANRTVGGNHGAQQGF